MTNTELLELAARVEAAMGADRELDALIHCAINGWPVAYEGNNVFADYHGTRILVGWIDPGVTQRNFTMTTSSVTQAYTASLDAAMTLVPANPEWEGGAAAFLLDFEAGTCLADFSCFARDRGEERLLMVRAATAPLALTAACLKAHALRACAAQPTPSVQEQAEK